MSNQFARKEMVDGVETGVARWKSKTIPLDTNYWDLPWEKEGPSNGKETCK